jgi:hypothetical protein
MADDISKNISIQITAETDKLEQNITNLNKIIGNLQSQQKQLADSGKETSAAFQNNADKIDIFQKKLQTAISQLNSFQSALNNAAGSLQKNQSLIAALTTAKDKYSKTVGDTSKKVNDLNTAIKTLSSAARQQQTQIAQSQAATETNNKALSDAAQQATNFQGSIANVSEALGQQQATLNNNKTAFDAHAAVMDHLKTSFDEIKDVSGEFGPGLKDAADGFNMMKTGLSVVKDGLYGIGDALKADGFDLLLQILQRIFDAFVQSSEGSKILKGAISAIGVIINDIKNFVGSFMDTIINAFSHPVDTIKSLGKTIMENIINRFTAFGVILDGIIHLDFKKMADGAIQAVTGVANATEKIVNAGKQVASAVKATGKEVAASYKQAYNQVDQVADASNKKMLGNISKQRKEIKNLKKAIAQSAIPSQSNNSTSEFPVTAKSGPADDGGDAALDQHVKTTAQINEQNQLLAMQVGIQQTIIKNDEKNVDNAKNITDKYNAEKQLIIDKSKLGIDQAQGDSEAIKQIKTQCDQQISQLDTQYQQQKAEQAKKKAQEIKDFEIKIAQELSSTAFSILQSDIKQQSDAKLAGLQKDEAAELNNTALTSTQKTVIRQKYQQQENAVKVKAFKEEQEASLAQAVINGALAVTKATSQSGALSPLVVPEIIAETAVQIAKIAAQKPPAYARGGLHYSSDGRGGVLPGYSRTDNVNAHLRSGEGIVVSEAMRDPWARSLVSAINVGFGGRDFKSTTTTSGFAVGGIFTDGGNANRYYNQPVTDNKNLANTIAYQMINNFPPVYVDVKDINNQQNILAQTINRVNL